MRIFVANRLGLMAARRCQLSALSRQLVQVSREEAQKAQKTERPLRLMRIFAANWLGLMADS